MLFEQVLNTRWVIKKDFMDDVMDLLGDDAIEGEDDEDGL